MIHQQLIVVPARCRGYHLITSMILKKLGELPDAGLLNLFIQHTSAALTINEKCRPFGTYRFRVGRESHCARRCILLYPYPWKETTICPPMSRARCSAPRSLYLFGTVGWLSVRGRVFICVSSVIMGETAVFWRHCIIEEEEANRICRVGQVFFLRNPVSGEPFLPTLK